MNWRERQALPGPRARFSFASVVPQIVRDELTQKITLVWPKKGSGHTYVKYPECRPGKGKLDRRSIRLRDPNVHHSVAA